MHIKSPSLAQPLETKLSVKNQPDHYLAQWTVTTGSPADAAMYELSLSPEGGVQSFKAELKLQEAKRLLRSAERLLSSSSSSDTYSSPSAASYLIRYDKPSSTSHSIKIYSPSRQMEGQYRQSSSEFLIRYHPHKGHSDKKYELYARKSHSSWPQQSRFEGGVTHPRYGKEMKVEAQYTRSEQTVTGSVELDIFPNSADKITGTIESHIISHNTIIAEALLTGKVSVNKSLIDMGSTP